METNKLDLESNDRNMFEKLERATWIIDSTLTMWLGLLLMMSGVVLIGFLIIGVGFVSLSALGEV
jgi:hypothetical protein